METLEDVLGDVAERLREGAQNRHLAMHFPMVATADADARIMVLREFERDGWRLRFHTDVRSPKCGLIGDGAPVGVLFYDREAKRQIRCKGRGWIERATPLVDAAWAQSTNYARRCYLGEGPGAVAAGPTSGLPDWAEGLNPSDEQVASAREHFAILLVELDQVDWFHLAHDGHKRAIIDLPGGEGHWVSP